MKTCTNPNCNQTNPQPDENFYRDRNSIRGRCKSCIKAEKYKYNQLNVEANRERCKKWKKLNKDKVKAGNLKNAYGIGLDIYYKMLESQNKVCAICGIDNPQYKNRHFFCVDHSHKDNSIRGLLCYPCNLAVGNLKDSIKNAQNLIKYLQQYEKE